MTHAELLKEIEERGDEGAEIMLLEPRTDYDQFIIGLAERGHETVVLYDKPALLDWLATVAGDDEEQDPSEAAQEHFGFNMSQAGPGYPMFLEILVDTPILGGALAD